MPPFRSDRKSTRLNSSHLRISYAVFCLKKKEERADGDVSARRAAGGRRGGPQRDCGQHAPADKWSGRHRGGECRIFSVFFFLKTRAPPRFTPFPHPAPSD